MAGVKLGAAIGTAGTFTYSPTEGHIFSNSASRFAMKERLGYFVLTSFSSQDNLGGLAGANTLCLNDLQSQSWKGKGANVTLNSSKVRAFLCDSTSCQNLLTNTTYSFAVAGDLAAGGARFTTNASGIGPNDLNAWSGVEYFNSSIHRYWTGRAFSDGLDNLWASTTSAGSSRTCSNWTRSDGTSDNGPYGYNGDSGELGSDRWSSDDFRCSGSRRLICMVDP